MKAIRPGCWSELCDNDVFFSELVETLLMQLMIEHRANIERENIKKEFEEKLEDYIKGGVPEWRTKNEKKQ